MSAESLGKLFDARGVAVVGASPDPAKLGSWPFRCLEQRRYQGLVYGVNPKHQTILGRPCVPRVTDLPDEVEAAIVMLPAAAAVEATEQCGERGIRAVVIGASGFGETGAEGKRLEARLLAAAERYDLSICGPNTDGAASLRTGQTLSYQPLLQRDLDFRTGGVTLISHSGAMTSTLLARFLPRRIGLNAVVACGNQLVLSMEDYLAYFADDPATDVVVLFVEAIARPDAMRAALRRCRANGKRVVALKIGQSAGGQRAAASHTGAIAGSYQNTLAIFEKEGALYVEDLEELAVLVQCLERQPAPLAEQKVAIVSISGGLAALAADCSERAGIPVQDLSPAAAERLGALSHLSQPLNPYDLAGVYTREFVGQVLDIFAADGFNTLLFGLGVLPDPPRGGALEAVGAATRGAFQHTYVYCPAPEPTDLAFADEHDVVLTQDLEPLLRALTRLRTARAPEATDVRDHGPAPRLPEARDEASLKNWLRELGLASPASAILRDDDLTALETLKRPLALKGLSAQVPHKTEHGLVELGLCRDDDIQAAAERIRGRLRQLDPASPGVLAEEMVRDGLEAIVGCVRDARLGPVVLVGSGGQLVELVGDTVVLVPPFSRAEAEARLARTRLWRLVSGYRGRRYDARALLDVVELVGRLATTLPDLVSLEINPLFIMPTGVLAGDAKLEVSS